jgi:hypothetical protein
MDANRSGRARQHVEASPRLAKGWTLGSYAEGSRSQDSDPSRDETGSRERQDVRHRGRPAAATIFVADEQRDPPELVLLLREAAGALGIGGRLM